MPIADLHCHYPMRLLAEGKRRRTGPALRAMTKLDKRGGWDRMKATILLILARGFNFRNIWDSWRVDLERLRAGEVDVVFSVLYLPDGEIDASSWPEGEPSEKTFGELLSHLGQVEDSLAGRAVVVTSKDDLTGEGDAGLPRFAHCVEGGFHLGADASAYGQRVRQLSQRGVAYITLAHLFWRQVATNAPALPFLSDSRYRWLFAQPPGVGLSQLGRAAVRAMFVNRVLIDISHMSEAAIDDTFELLDDLDDEFGTRPEEYPVLATHAGHRFGDQSYMLSEETIARVAARDGVIGLIMAHHQLNDGLFKRRGGLKRTLAALHAHIDAIHAVTGSHRHTGIGSDLDGFIKPTVGGIEYAEDLAKLIAPLRRTYAGEADAILRNNAVRALRRTLVEPLE